MIKAAESEALRMGMFDDVTCLAPLPDDYAGDRARFQTKDLDRTLDRYVITEDGRLLVNAFRLEDNPDWKGWAAGFLDGSHPFDRVELGQVEVGYDGLLKFYGGSTGTWHEYEAKFTDGRLVEIKQIGKREARR
jgi:hypothetical protein